MFEKLRLKPGDRLLDVGCGWGGMVRYAARRGVQAIGVTLSREQTSWAQQAIADEGLADLAEVRYGDYRDIAESGFDAVSSIGLLEHIGVRNYPSYFRFLQSRLRPGRAAAQPLHHPPRQPSEPSTRGFIDRYVFPDGELTGSGRIITEAQDVGLEVLHEENLRPPLRDDAARLVRQPRRALGRGGRRGRAARPRRCGACTWPDRGSPSRPAGSSCTRCSRCRPDDRERHRRPAAATVVDALTSRIGSRLRHTPAARNGTQRRWFEDRAAGD